MTTNQLLGCVTRPFLPQNFELYGKMFKPRTHKLLCEGGDESPLRFGRIVIDPQSRLVNVCGQMIDLTVTEFNLLWFMASYPRQVFNREQLLKYVWGVSEYVDPSTVTVHIRRLRKKMEENPSYPKWIFTIWGVGYKFEPHCK